MLFTKSKFEHVGASNTLYRCLFFFSSRRRHTRFDCDWSSDVCSSDLLVVDRRVHGRDLLDPTDERPARLLEVTSLESGDRDLREDATLGVVSVGREPEADRRDVILVLVHEVRRELGRLADQDW